MSATVVRFNEVSSIRPSQVYLDTSIIIWAFYEYPIYQRKSKNISGDELKRSQTATTVYHFVDSLLGWDTRCCISLLAFEEAFNKVRRLVRDRKVTERGLPKDITDKELRSDHNEIWKDYLSKSRLQVETLNTRILNHNLYILAPNSQDVASIVARVQGLHQRYCLDMADYFHLAIGMQFGINQFVTTDGPWQQVDEIIVYADRHRREWLTP